jgi:hypothetical protein
MGTGPAASREISSLDWKGINLLVFKENIRAWTPPC